MGIIFDCAYFAAIQGNLIARTRPQSKFKIPACCWCKLGKLHAYPSGVMAGRRNKRETILRHRRVIGDAIRLRRKKADFTQERLAELADLNPKYLGEIERGEKIISIEALLRIAKAVKTPIHEFFRGV